MHFLRRNIYTPGWVGTRYCFLLYGGIGRTSTTSTRASSPKFPRLLCILLKSRVDSLPTWINLLQIFHPPELRATRTGMIYNLDIGGRNSIFKSIVEQSVLPPPFFYTGYMYIGTWLLLGVSYLIFKLGLESFFFLKKYVPLGGKPRKDGQAA